MTYDAINHLFRLLKHVGRMPPRDVLLSIIGVLGPEEVEKLPKEMWQGWFTEADGSTTWYVLGVTPDLVVTVEARASQAPWNFTQGAQAGRHIPADSLTVSARRRASVSSISATSVQPFGDEGEGYPAEWRHAWRVAFDDGGYFDIPIELQHGEAKRAEVLVQSLLAELRRR